MTSAGSPVDTSPNGGTPSTLRRLKQAFAEQHLYRPFRTRRYDPGDELTYEITGIAPCHRGRLRLKIERFVGGGFAGQVYKVLVLELACAEGPVPGLDPGRSYALKILVPPSGFARIFRNLVYFAAFQAPFAPQLNPDAARSGALWQKFFRRGAATVMGDSRAVVDILATLVDNELGGAGEISEWVEGRPWRFEVDDDLDARRRWNPGDLDEGVGSPEYRSKKAFMARLVRLMQEMGAPELARQYEWWTCKSQPNVLKRRECETNPTAGHVAVDFRAGLALLFFLPMSPADLKLILRGLMRGRLVQFDRGNLGRLQRFMEKKSGLFEDMQEAYAELERTDRAYREALPDISSHHLRLLYSRKLWRSILRSHTLGLVLRRHIDDRTAARLSDSGMKAALLYLSGILPFLGRFLRRLWGHRDFRRHYRFLLTNPEYLLRTWKARRAESLIQWQRTARVTANRADRLKDRPLRFAAHMPLSLLPPGLHRFLSDRRYARERLDFIFLRPLRLYFKSEARESWLRETVTQGERNGMLTREEADRIRSRIRESFIQKYLKSLAVHVCTVPVTQIVSVLVAVFYIRLHPELSWQDASLRAGLILGLFQVTPISPGSLVRGLYVTFLVLREHNFQDYRLAFFLSFFKYIGYLAFPIQMAYRYPDLARFMAGHWATGAVHFVPVFGERGALLEHAVFDLFYNYPLTIRRRMRQRKMRRSSLKTRVWHVFPSVLCGLGVLLVIDLIYARLSGQPPHFESIWWAILWIPIMTAVVLTSGAGGASLGQRLALAGLGGGVMGWMYAVGHAWLLPLLMLPAQDLQPITHLIAETAAPGFWQAFIFALLALITALIVETRRLRS